MFPSIVERVIASYCWQTTLSEDIGIHTAVEKIILRNARFTCNSVKKEEPAIFQQCVSDGDHMLFLKWDGPQNIIWRTTADSFVCTRLSEMKFAENERITAMLVGPINRWLIIVYQILYTVKEGDNVCALRIINLHDYSVLYDGSSHCWNNLSMPQLSEDERMLILSHWDAAGQYIYDILEIRNSFLDRDIL